jgi:hypothetical protein
MRKHPDLATAGESLMRKHPDLATAGPPMRNAPAMLAGRPR